MDLPKGSVRHFFGFFHRISMHMGTVDVDIPCSYWAKSIQRRWKGTPLQNHLIPADVNSLFFEKSLSWNCGWWLLVMCVLGRWHNVNFWIWIQCFRINLNLFPSRNTPDMSCLQGIRLFPPWVPPPCGRPPYASISTHDLLLPSCRGPVNQLGKFSLYGWSSTSCIHQDERFINPWICREHPWTM